jgi:hypothetical protein
MLIIGLFFYDEILFFLSKEPNCKSFIWLIPFIGFVYGIFRNFYAWLRVHMHCFFGNFIKEVGLRLFSLLLLIAVYYDILTVEGFVYATAVVFGITSDNVLRI